MGSFAKAKVALLATVSVLGLSGPAVADAEHIWKHTSSIAETRLEAKNFTQFAEEVQAGTDGAVEIETYFNSALGIDPQDELRALRDGAIEIATPYYGYLGRDLPALSVVVMQGALLDAQSALDVADTLKDIFTEQYERWNATIVGWQMGPVYDMSIFCKEPVNTLDDLAGKKVRVWSREQVLTFEKLGVPAQILPQTEIYSALQTGVIDCAIYVVGNAKTISIQEVTDYAAQLHVYTATPEPIAVNLDAWNALTEEQQAAVRAAGEQAWQRSVETAISGPAQREKDVGEELAAAGSLTVLPPFSDEDKARFLQAVAEVWQSEAEAIGPEAVAYRERVLQALQGN